MRELSAVLRPGVTLRIERTRPTWAAGFLEDYPIEVGDALRSLLEHLRDEHGGQHYRLTVLGAGEQALYSGSLPIAGPVRDRGKPITREAWESPRERNPAPVVQPAQGGSDLASIVGMLGGAIGPLFTFLQKQSDRASQQTIDAVRDMARTSQRQTSELTNAVLQIRTDTQQRSGLAGQVSELIEGISAVDDLRSRVGTGERSGSGDPKEDEMSGALREAAKHFFTQFMGHMATQRSQSPAQQPQQRRPNRTRVVRPHTVPPNGVGADVGEQPPGLPDAISGQ